MSKILVLVADSTCARVFNASSSGGSLEEIATLTHPENRLKEKSMVSDRPGYAFSSHGHGRNALSKHEDQKEHEINSFINEINDYLKKLESRNEFNQLIIIAAPKLLGALKKHLKSSIQKNITYELKKNIAKLTAEEIRTHLPKFLANPDL